MCKGLDEQVSNMSRPDLDLNFSKISWRNNLSAERTLLLDNHDAEKSPTGNTNLDGRHFHCDNNLHFKPATTVQRAVVQTGWWAGVNTVVAVVVVIAALIPVGQGDQMISDETLEGVARLSVMTSAVESPVIGSDERIDGGAGLPVMTSAVEGPLIGSDERGTELPVMTAVWEWMGFTTVGCVLSMRKYKIEDNDNQLVLCLIFLTTVAATGAAAGLGVLSGVLAWLEVEVLAVIVAGIVLLMVVKTVVKAGNPLEHAVKYGVFLGVAAGVTILVASRVSILVPTMLLILILVVTKVIPGVKSETMISVLTLEVFGFLAGVLTGLGVKLGVWVGTKATTWLGTAVTIALGDVVVILCLIILFQTCLDVKQLIVFSVSALLGAMGMLLGALVSLWVGVGVVSGATAVHGLGAGILVPMSALLTVTLTVTAVVLVIFAAIISGRRG